jgi:hypothetical protein
MRSLLLIAAACLAGYSSAWAESKPLKPTNTWTGRVDAEQAKAAPKLGYIANEKAFAELWTAWKIKGTAPKIDFKKELAIVALSQSSGMGINPMLDKDGDLTWIVIATADITADFGFQIVTVPRADVKTVVGKPIEEK